MAAPLGQSFAPIGAADEETKKMNPAQQAIQVLSMRIPRVRGARTISPLIGESRSAAASQVGGFSPESAVLQTLMQTIGAGASLPTGTMPGGGMGGAMSALGGGMPPSPQAPNAPPSFEPPVIVPGGTELPEGPGYVPPVRVPDFSAPPPATNSGVSHNTEVANFAADDVIGMRRPRRDRG
jgi:hypothetical protein